MVVAPPCGLNVIIPDKDDDGGRLSHGPDHAAYTDNTQEGEECTLTAGAGALPW